MKPKHIKGQVHWKYLKSSLQKWHSVERSAKISEQLSTDTTIQRNFLSDKRNESWFTSSVLLQKCSKTRRVYLTNATKHSFCISNNNYLFAFAYLLLLLLRCMHWNLFPLTINSETTNRPFRAGTP